MTVTSPRLSVPSERQPRGPQQAPDLWTIAFRAADVPVVDAVDLRILLDAAENYPAWEAAIDAARTSIHLEMYLVHPDRTGRRFRDRLADRARAGVPVRVLCDWFGCFDPRMLGFWRPLLDAGGEVRWANPPALDDVFGLIRRDHRKLLVVDRAIGFVSGLCVGDDWAGDPRRGKEPWRDTGLSFRGAAAAQADEIFREAWRLWGDPVPPPADSPVAEGGDRVAVGLIAASPDHAPVYRLDLTLAAMASQRLLVTDAYFVPTSAYTSALIAAAQRGVDVRVLVPGGSDLQWVGAFSRTFYRRLLEGGVRVFEWDGSMLHAKTAVVDGRIVRVGSTNLNTSSWVHNWELDAVIDDSPTGLAMEAVYERDLERGTEIVLSPASSRVQRAHRRAGPRRRRRGGRARRAARQAALFGSALGSAIRDARQLGLAESRSLMLYGCAISSLGVIVIWRPALLAYPVGLAMAWLGLSLLARGVRVRWFR